ncbi:MAG: hypothetical protein ACYC3F_09705 [Gemmatimonadaceae bacterium]
MSGPRRAYRLPEIVLWALHLRREEQPARNTHTQPSRRRSVSGIEHRQLIAVSEHRDVSRGELHQPGQFRRTECRTASELFYSFREELVSLHELRRIPVRRIVPGQDGGRLSRGPDAEQDFEGIQLELLSGTPGGSGVTSLNMGAPPALTSRRSGRNLELAESAAQLRHVRDVAVPHVLITGNAKAVDGAEPDAQLLRTWSVYHLIAEKRKVRQPN